MMIFSSPITEFQLRSSGNPPPGHPESSAVARVPVLASRAGPLLSSSIPGVSRSALGCSLSQDRASLWVGLLSAVMALQRNPHLLKDAMMHRDDADT